MGGLDYARLTDIWVGECCCHHDPDCEPMSGPIISASPNSSSGNLRQARLTDITVGECGHTGTIVSASTLAFTNSLGKAIITDCVTGCNIGIIVKGKSDHKVGG